VPHRARALSLDGIKASRVFHNSVVYWWLGLDPLNIKVLKGHWCKMTQGRIGALVKATHTRYKFNVSKPSSFFTYHQV
jgi:hypothetical protein